MSGPLRVSLLSKSQAIDHSKAEVRKVNWQKGDAPNDPSSHGGNSNGSK